MYELVLRNVPSKWDSCSVRNRVTVPSFDEEFRQIQFELNKALNSELKISNLTRIQNVYDYGQFLFREQLLAINSTNKYYRVRRYIKIDKGRKDIAIEYNLDTRRCNLTSLNLRKTLEYPLTNEVIFVVQVVTDKPDADCITPTNSLEYYIEYLAEC